MQFREDIQILRGLAVTLVVLFHFGFSSVQSGFLGVDVFFVISGFLMGVLYNNHKKKEFFLRRAKRLLPAYFFTILTTGLVALLLVTPNEWQQVVKQIGFASFFTSNVGFWFQNSYFSKAEFNPLLHLWSLGVEIQFYMLVPLVYWFASKFKITTIALAIISMIICLLITTISPKTSFFMLPTRMWEFLVGYLIAFHLTNSGNVKYKTYSLLKVIPLILILSIPLFKVNGESLSFINGHPGLPAIAITLATAFILIYGLPSLIVNSFIGKILLKVGNYSYSIYLVHFPVIVLYNYSPFSGTTLSVDNNSDLLIIFLIILALSVLSFNLIEKKKFKLGTISLTYFGLALTMMLFGSKFQEQSLSTEDIYIAQVNQDRGYYRCGKMIRLLEPTAKLCDLTPSLNNYDNSILLLGNSHADSIKDTFVNVAKQHNTKVYFAIENNPLMSGGLKSDFYLDYAANNKINKIVLHYKKDSIETSELVKLIGSSKNKGISVYLVEPVPIYEKNIPKYLYGRDKNELMSLSLKNRTTYMNENHQVSEFRSILGNASVAIDDIFCPDNCLLLSPSFKPLYFDGNHLTLSGSKMLRDKFTYIISQP
ncbi:acyltransferase family protein [Vibrio breoganii]|uniref:acyltransferase family protein n=1 Tax=Vibrio breoganii TaxID=553239 RepID=UPI000CBD0C53|nr:acyltransferase family protein [Vibrio breoganii]PMK42721.1 hypothetical protein BCU00_12380 [Vibrio breoganii]